MEPEPALIRGAVNLTRREATTRLIVFGGEGRGIEVEAVLDTGFTDDLTLPASLIEALELRPLRVDSVMLSDGSIVECAIYEATIGWLGGQRVVEVQASDSNPLIGMGLLLEHLVTLPVTEGGVWTIKTLLPSEGEEPLQ